jgi:YD repeat-containing protein
MGRVLQSRQTTGAQSYDLTYAWTQIGALQSETLHQTRQIVYGFDAFGRPSSVTWTKGAESGWTATVDEYTALGAFKKLRFGSNLLVEEWAFSTKRPQQARRMTLGPPGTPERDSVLEYSYCAGRTGKPNAQRTMET